MTTLFEQQGVQYELQGDYRLPCVTLPNENDYEIGVWGERHRRYLKEHYRVRYYNFLTAGILDNYLANIEIQAEKIFEQTVKSLAENENVTEELKATLPMDWVLNTIRMYKKWNIKILYKGFQEFTELNEITPTVVNKLIERIEIHNNKKKHSHNNVKVDIYFTAIGLFDIPTKQELL